MENQCKRWKMIVGRCPPVKTVPYTCLPGATDTSQCIYGEHFIPFQMFLTMRPMHWNGDLQRYIPWHLLPVGWGFTTLPKVDGLLWAWELKFRWSLINAIWSHSHFGQYWKTYQFMIISFNGLKYWDLKICSSKVYLCRAQPWPKVKLRIQVASTPELAHQKPTASRLWLVLEGRKMKFVHTLDVFNFQCSRHPNDF